MKIVVGNIKKDISQNHLRERLEQFGHVKSLKIENKMVIVEMSFENEEESAFLNLDKSQFEGMTLSIHEARFNSIDRRINGRIGGRRSQDPKSYTIMFKRQEN